MMLNLKILSSILVLSIFVTTPVFSHVVSGVAKVIDGDTLKVQGTVVRLYGIDAAETGQRCVTSSRQIVRPSDTAIARIETLVKGGVNCVGDEFDAYSRLIATCTSPSGKNINRTLIEEGLAWAFVKYSSAFVTEERQAQKSQLGVWQLACEQPWVFREKRWKVAEQKAPNGCPIKGNISASGHIYHTPWSRHYAGTRVDVGRGEKWFCSEKEAIDAGWRAPIR